MFIVYGSPSCPNCDTVKQILDQNNLEYTYIDVYEDLVAQALFKEKGFRTVPQIFVGEQHIGGYKELINSIR